MTPPSDRLLPANFVLFVQVEKPPVTEYTYTLNKVNISYFCASHMIFLKHKALISPQADLRNADAEEQV